MFMHQLWQLKIDWDDQLTTELKEHWQSLQHNLPIVNGIQIDRLVFSKEKLRKIELHGFSDASEVAYGACIYLQSINVQGNITTRLLCSKSGVAPLKILSLPRLELCAAMLLEDVPSFIKSLEDKFQQDKILD